MRGNILPLIKFVAHFCGNKQIRAGQPVTTYPGHAYRIVNQFMIAQCEQTFPFGDYEASPWTWSMFAKLTGMTVYTAFAAS